MLTNAPAQAGVASRPWSAARAPADRAGLGGLRLTLHSTLAAAEATWRDLAHGGVMTPYQDFDWAQAWFTHLGQRAGVTPAIVVVSDAEGRPVALLPFVRRRLGPLAGGAWLGGKHANFNMGVFDAAHDLEPGLVQAAVAEAARMMGVDLLVLLNQPQGWGGAPNPLAALERTRSAVDGWSVRLDGNYEDVIRRVRGKSFKKRLRWRERQLEKSGPLRFERVDTLDRARQVLELFLAQKSERFAQLGKANAFEDDGADEFALAMAELVAKPDAVIELFALWAGEEMVAMVCGGSTNGRFSGFFTSIACGELARFSPSQVLIPQVFENLCSRGFVGFDLGVGDSHYKTMWCEREELFDCFVGVTPAGRVAARVLREGYGLKRRVKSNERLMRWVEFAQARLSGKAPAGDVAERDTGPEA